MEEPLIKEEAVDPSPTSKGRISSEEDILQEAAKPGAKYCKSCDIYFNYYSTFIAHKKFYCSSHAGRSPPRPPTTTTIRRLGQPRRLYCSCLGNLIIPVDTHINENNTVKKMELYLFKMTEVLMLIFVINDEGAGANFC
ncbi:hypothetical protein NQ318_005503 [Aromia moschata]|uniref:Uncharacterized protein n=1 Tax=Aromia moschata TaxID=1265417 RepID=A0AAV8YBG7_9CUCU|nr:hypothetical protein NQ318_005503 [Aromia moschata]